MGGEIWLASAPGQGSSFYVNLPFGLPSGWPDSSAAHGEGAVPTVQPPLPEQTPPRVLSVLLVEDTPANVIIAQSFLARLGHRAAHAPGGRQALALLARERFDVVLMDVEMPGMDGLTATRLLRAGEAGELNRSVTVLAMTAHVLESFRSKCAEAGMNGFLPKPVSFKTLAETLNALELPIASGRESEVRPEKRKPKAPQDPQGDSARGQGPAETDGDAAARAKSLADGPMLADLDKASEMLGGYEELLCEVLEMFLTDLPAKRGAVAEALREDDMFATAKIGAVLLTVNTHYRKAEIEYLLKQSDCENLVIIDGFRDTDYVGTLYDLIPELRTQERGHMRATCPEFSSSLPQASSTTLLMASISPGPKPSGRAPCCGAPGKAESWRSPSPMPRAISRPISWPMAAAMRSAASAAPTAPTTSEAAARGFLKGASAPWACGSPSMLAVSGKFLPSVSITSWALWPRLNISAMTRKTSTASGRKRFCLPVPALGRCWAKRFFQ